MPHILRAININKTYGNQTILDDINFTVEAGKIYVIEGKSGSGKSTFLSILGGMENPTSGRLYYQDKLLYDMAAKEQAKIRGLEFGFVFQMFHLFPELTVQENIELPTYFQGIKKDTVKIKELTSNLEIESLLRQKTSFLSGGEQQRVAIARALIGSPKIIFADEPTGNLDEETSERIVELLIKLCKERKISLVIVTHQKALINVPHALYRMQNGQLKVVSNDV